MAKKARKSARGRKQDRARVAGGQDKFGTRRRDPQVGICREEGVRKVGSGRKRVERKR